MWSKAATSPTASTAEKGICEQKGSVGIRKVEPRNKHLMLVYQPCQGKELFSDHLTQICSPLYIPMDATGSSIPSLCSWFHALKQPLDYNLAFHVDFPTGENALTSQHEHLVSLAGASSLYMENALHWCSGLASVSSYTLRLQSSHSLKLLGLPASPVPPLLASCLGMSLDKVSQISHCFSGFEPFLFRLTTSL